MPKHQKNYRMNTNNYKSVTELATNHPNLCEYLEQVEAERDTLAVENDELHGLLVDKSHTAYTATKELKEAKREAEAWKESAAFHCRNEFFWHDLVDQCGKHFGVEARTSDDGSIQEDVLGLKVPELVERTVKKNLELSEILHEISLLLPAAGPLEGRNLDLVVQMTKIGLRDIEPDLGEKVAAPESVRLKSASETVWDLAEEIDRLQETEEELAFIKAVSRSMGFEEPFEAVLAGQKWKESQAEQKAPQTDMCLKRGVWQSKQADC